jgi:hypothetical protein
MSKGQIACLTVGTSGANSELETLNRPPYSLSNCPEATTFRALRGIINAFGVSPFDP